MNNLNVNWVPGITLDEMEKACILSALKFYRGNMTQTAISLGVSDRTIRNKMEKYEADGKLERERYERENLDRAKVLERMRGIQPGAVLEASQSSLYRADTGVHMESVVKNTAQQPVPVPEPKEVQAVLPKATPQGGHGKRR